MTVTESPAPAEAVCVEVPAKAASAQANASSRAATLPRVMKEVPLLIADMALVLLKAPWEAVAAENRGDVECKATGSEPPAVAGGPKLYSPNIVTMSLTIEGTNSPRLTARAGSKRGPGTATNCPGATCLTSAG